jgi:hypothetical protein
MAHPYSLTTTYSSTTAVSAGDLNRRAKVMLCQLPGLAASVGHGVLPYPDSGALLVTGAGDGVSVAAGEAIAVGPYGSLAGVADTRGGIYLAVTSPQSVAAPDDAGDLEEAHLFLVPKAYNSAAPSTPDGAAGAVGAFVWDTGETLAGGVRLARVTFSEAGAVTKVDDERDWFPEEVLRQVATALQAAVEDHETRIAELEAAIDELLVVDEEGEPATLYVGANPYLVSDPRNWSVVYEADKAALRAELLTLIQSGGTRPMVTPLDQLVAEHAITRQLAIRLSAESALTINDGERSQSANLVQMTDETIFGDGTNGHPDFIDTDMTINADGTIEV